MLLLAEKFLESVEGSQNYLLLLLHLMDKADVDMHLRVGASITFKNFVKRNWKIVSMGTYCETYNTSPWHLLEQVFQTLTSQLVLETQPLFDT